MLQVFHPSLVVDEDVIQIHHYKITSESSQDIVHHPHKICWSICQTEGHDQPFKKTLFLLEGGLPYICLFYWDLVVARLQFNLTELFGPYELIKKVVDLGNRVLVPDCDFIQGSVINAELSSLVFLLHQYDLASTRR
jgi:hypothetical protein